MVTETSDEPSLAKSSKPGLVTKRRKPTSSLSLVDEFVDEGIPEKEHRFDDEEDDMQRVVEESFKKVQGKGKDKVSDEQVALDLLTLQTPKKEVPPVVKIGAQDEGQIGPNLGVQIKGQAGLNLGDDAKPQPQSSPVVHDGPNLEHMDLAATDVSTQQNPSFSGIPSSTNSSTKLRELVGLRRLVTKPDLEALTAAGFVTGATLGAKGLDFLVALAGLGAGDSGSLSSSPIRYL
nr:hypothetical protein [Tanacetum cinerariifolium]